MIELLDVEGFGDHFQIEHPSDIIRVVFQNCCHRPQCQHNKKAQDSTTTMNADKYDVMLVAEHRLNPPKLQLQEG